MSVLACDRNGCENIMCDILVLSTYYVCEECAEEFISKTILPDDATDETLNVLFTQFMGSAFSYPQPGESTSRAEEFIDSYRR